jgi:hypothetical protein
MKQFLLVTALFYSVVSFAAEPAAPAAAPAAATPAAAASAEEAWSNTTLTDALIAKVQAASFEYKNCAATEMQKPDYANIDVRKATETVIKECEPVLSKIREAYLSEKVPAVIADRQLKKMRIQTTRNILAELMFRDAARKAGQ